MRIMGLDYGSRRIGVALSDELGMTAQPLTTVERRNRQDDMEAIARLVGTYSVEKIVVGYPVRLDGTEGIQCEKVNRFARRLEVRFRLPVVKWDETLSTWTAGEILNAAHVRREKRKKVIDKMAAGIILQGYLDSLGPAGARKEGCEGQS
jgi:putative Holliday junction resolvase